MSKTFSDTVTQALSLQRQYTRIADQALQKFQDTEDVRVLQEAFTDLDTNAETWVKLGGASMHGLALALYQIQKIWDKLPQEFTSQWNYDFWDYSSWRAKASHSTVRNLVTVAKVFLADEVALPGRPKEFNPWEVNHTNLIIASHAARTGDLGEDGWKALSNPNTTWNELRQMVHSVKNVSSNGQDPQKPQKPYFYVDQGTLRYSENGVVVILGTLEEPNVVAFEDQEEHSVFDHGMLHLRKVLGID